MSAVKLPEHRNAVLVRNRPIPVIDIRHVAKVRYSHLAPRSGQSPNGQIRRAGD